MSKPEYQKAYQEANKERIKEQHRIWYEKNKEIILARQKEDRKNHPEKYKAIDKKKWDKHKDSYSKNRKEKYIANKNKHSLKRRMLRLEAMKIIAKYHSTELECHICGEKRAWVLTIGHLNRDEKKDREKYGTNQQFYKSIINGTKTC